MELKQHNDINLQQEQIAQQQHTQQQQQQQQHHASSSCEQASIPAHEHSSHAYTLHAPCDTYLPHTRAREYAHITDKFAALSCDTPRFVFIDGAAGNDTTPTHVSDTHRRYDTYVQR